MLFVKFPHPQRIYVVWRTPKTLTPLRLLEGREAGLGREWVKGGRGC